MKHAVGDVNPVDPGTVVRDSQRRAFQGARSGLVEPCRGITRVADFPACVIMNGTSGNL